MYLFIASTEGFEVIGKKRIFDYGIEVEISKINKVELYFISSDIEFVAM